jgi:hypothetical protein
MPEIDQLQQREHFGLPLVILRNPFHGFLGQTAILKNPDSTLYELRLGYMSCVVDPGFSANVSIKAGQSDGGLPFRQVGLTYFNREGARDNAKTVRTMPLQELRERYDKVCQGLSRLIPNAGLADKMAMATICNVQLLIAAHFVGRLSLFDADCLPDTIDSYSRKIHQPEKSITGTMDKFFGIMATNQEQLTGVSVGQ